MTRTLRQTTVISREKIELLVMSDEVVLSLNSRVNIRIINGTNVSLLNFYTKFMVSSKKTHKNTFIFFFSYLGFY